VISRTISSSNLNIRIEKRLFLFVIALILWFSGKAEEDQKQEIIVKYPEPIVLSLRPLPHYKGYGLPPKVEVKDLGDGMKSVFGTIMGGSTPEYNLLEPSHKLESYKGCYYRPGQFP